MDSGHLSYHLESLGDLTTRFPDRKNRLSSFGMAAVKLISGVEEHDSSSATPKRRNIVNLTTAIFSVALAIALLTISARGIQESLGGFILCCFQSVILNPYKVLCFLSIRR